MADINEELYDAALQFALSQTTFEKSASRVENETEAKQNLDSILRKENLLEEDPDAV